MLRLFNNSKFIQQFHIYSIIFIQYPYLYSFNNQKQPPRGVPRKRCCENMQQIYKRTLMPKRDFIKVARKRCSENMQQIYRRTPMPKCDINKIALQLYCNRTSAWVFSCKFAAYFQNTFSSEHLWTGASAKSKESIFYFIPTLPKSKEM